MNRREKKRDGGQGAKVKVNDVTVTADWQHDYAQEYISPGQGPDIPTISRGSVLELYVSMDDFGRLTKLPANQHVRLEIGTAFAGPLYFRGGRPDGAKVMLRFTSVPPGPLEGGLIGK
jgi:hypothetical protein